MFNSTLACCVDMAEALLMALHNASLSDDPVGNFLLPLVMGIGVFFSEQLTFPVDTVNCVTSQDSFSTLILKKFRRQLVTYLANT